MTRLESYTLIAMLLLFLYSCSGISNGRELRVEWEKCKKHFKEQCLLVAVPESKFEEIKLFIMWEDKDAN